MTRVSEDSLKGSNLKPVTSVFLSLRFNKCILIQGLIAKTVELRLLWISAVQPNEHTHISKEVIYTVKKRSGPRIDPEVLLKREVML